MTQLYHRTSTIGIVVLNYLDYDESYENIKSYYSTNKKDSRINIKFYLIDNQSNSEKLNRFKKKLLSKHWGNEVVILENKENLGFAQGMNTGLNAARSDGCDFVICSNSDIRYGSEFDFNILLNQYYNNDKIGQLGVRIKGLDGSDQNPMYGLERRPKEGGAKAHLKRIVFFSTPMGKVLYYLAALYKYFWRANETVVDKQQTVNGHVSREVYCLHGAYFMLTPAYFREYSGLDPNTFLLGEELIIAERMYKSGLHGYYLSELEVQHATGASMNKLFEGKNFAKTMASIKNRYDSSRYISKHYRI